MTTVYYDLNQNKFIYHATGKPVNQNDFPVQNFQTQQKIKCIVGEFSTEDNVFKAKDLTTLPNPIVSWRAALKINLSDTDPVVRTLNGNIDASQQSEGIIIVTLDSDNQPFWDAVNAKENVESYFEIVGYNSIPKAELVIKPWAKCFYIAPLLDPDGTDNLPGVVSNYFDKTECIAAFQGLITGLDSISRDLAPTDEIYIAGLKGTLAQLVAYLDTQITGVADGDELVKFNEEDTTAGYLVEKLVNIIELAEGVAVLKSAIIDNAHIASDADIELSKLEAQPDESTIAVDEGLMKVIDVPETVSQAIYDAIIDSLTMADLAIFTALAVDDLLMNSATGWINATPFNVVQKGLTKALIEAVLTGPIDTHEHNFQIENGIADSTLTIEQVDNGVPLITKYDEDSATKPDELQLLMHFTGSAASTVLEDKSGKSRAITRVIDTGGVCEIAESGQSGQCLKLDGGYLTTPYNAGFNNPAGPFAIDFFFKALDETTRTIPIFYIPGVLKIAIDYDGVNSIFWAEFKFTDSAEWTKLSYNTSLSTTDWKHFLVQVVNGFIYIGIEGPNNGIVEVAYPIDSRVLEAFETGNICIGGLDSPEAFGHGYIDELRYHSSAVFDLNLTSMTYSVPAISTYVTRAYVRGTIGAGALETTRVFVSDTEEYTMPTAVDRVNDLEIIIESGTAGITPAESQTVNGNAGRFTITGPNISFKFIPRSGNWITVKQASPY